MSPLETGFGYLAVAGTAIIWANVSAVLVNRVGVKPVMLVGMSLLSRRPAPVHTGLGRRLVLDRPVPRLPRHRPRDAVRVRPGDDRGGRGRQPRPGRSRIRPDQHVAADRRRARHRRPVRDRHLGYEPTPSPAARLSRRRSWTGSRGPSGSRRSPPRSELWRSRSSCDAASSRRPPSRRPSRHPQPPADHAPAPATAIRWQAPGVVLAWSYDHACVAADRDRARRRDLQLALRCRAAGS